MLIKAIVDAAIPGSGNQGRIDRSFLLLIGLALLLEGFDQHIPKGYIYFAMGFSVLVELLNIRARRRQAHSAPVELHQRYARTEERSDRPDLS